MSPIDTTELLPRESYSVYKGEYGTATSDTFQDLNYNLRKLFNTIVYNHSDVSIYYDCD